MAESWGPIMERQKFKYTRRSAPLFRLGIDLRAAVPNSGEQPGGRWAVLRTPPPNVHQLANGYSRRNPILIEFGHDGTRYREALSQTNRSSMSGGPRVRLHKVRASNGGLNVASGMTHAVGVVVLDELWIYDDTWLDDVPYAARHALLQQLRNELSEESVDGLTLSISVAELYYTPQQLRELAAAPAAGGEERVLVALDGELGNEASRVAYVAP